MRLTPRKSRFRVLVEAQYHGEVVYQTVISGLRGTQTSNGTTYTVDKKVDFGGTDIFHGPSSGRRRVLREVETRVNLDDVKDDRLFRVIVLGGIAIAGAVSSVASCASEPHHEGPPPPQDLGTATALPSSSSTVTMATALPSASATPVTSPSAVVVPVREGPPPPPPLPPRKGPPPHREGPPPPPPTR